MGRYHEYVRQLRAELDALAEKPVTLGRAEEAAVYASLIRDLERLPDGGEDARTTSSRAFDEADAKSWTARMVNADGSHGAHWTMEQTSAAARSIGVDPESIGAAAWFAAMNMIYSDYCAVAREFGVDRPDFYARMARAFFAGRGWTGRRR